MLLLGLSKGFAALRTPTTELNDLGSFLSLQYPPKERWFDIIVTLRILQEMAENPLVSVIIPTYNRKDLLRRAISSVVEQTYNNIEIIIIDDDSDEPIRDVVSSFNIDDLHLIEHDENKGGSAARNTGIARANGEYLAFLDSDDEWLPEKIEAQVQCFNKAPDIVGAVYCRLYYADDTTGYLHSPEEQPGGDGLPLGYFSGDLRSRLLSGWCPATTSLFMVKSECFDLVDGFDESLSSFQDYDLWLRISKYYHFEYVPNELVIKHDHSGVQVSTDTQHREIGVNQFFDKWQNQFLTNNSKEELEHLKGLHLSEMYWQSTINSRRRRHMIHNFLRYLKYSPTEIDRRIVILFAIMLFGRKIYPLIKSVVHCYTRQPYIGRLSY